MELKRRIPLLIIMLVLRALSVSAQQESIVGRVIDKETRTAMTRTTLQLYHLGTSRNGKQDTTFVKGVYTDNNGLFEITQVKAGSYLLKITFLGYKEQQRKLTKTNGQKLDLGNILLETDAIQLNEAVVTANVPKMVVRDDTLIYNADAFRVPEGSVIEALVEALPGAKIEEDGGVSINGKSVKRFKMDGRDFMTGNNDAVMKNLPSYVVDQVKAYDEKSDNSRLTGIDDGEDDFVLEFVTRRSARNGLQMNPDLGIGTDGRYGIRLTAMKPMGATRYTFMGNANNVNDRNFTGRGGRGRGNNNGLRHTKTAALDISYENDKNLKISGRVTWTHRNVDDWNRSNSESFVMTRNGAFSSSLNQNYSRNNNWTGNMNLQWTIDSLTTLSFRPNLSISTNDGRGFSKSASYSDNPFDLNFDPLSDEGMDYFDAQNMILNGRNNKSMSYGSNKNLSSQIQLFRRLNSKGRNMSINSNINFRDGSNKNANLSAVTLFQQADHLGNDSTYQTNRYTVSPSDNFSWSLGFTYTEPIYIFKSKPKDQEQQEGRFGRGYGGFGGGRGGGRGGGGRGGRGRQMVGQEGIFFQTSYRYNYSHQKSDPSTYDFPEFNTEAYNNVLQEYRDWTRLFGYLENPYEAYLSRELSRYSERTEYRQNIDLQIRISRQKYNMNVGVSIQPQRSHYIQQYLGQPVDTVRNVTNISPTLNLRYRFNEQTNLQVTLRGQTQQPSINQLLEIYDDTNPLSITIGNPGLKPSYTSNLNANFQMQRRYQLVEDSLGAMVPKNQRHWSFNANGSFQHTSNAIGNVITYNETTGGSVSRPENINGNWNISGGATLNINLDTLNRWDVSGSIRGSYNHRVGYVNLNRTSIADRNVTHTYNLSPELSLSYRNSWLSFSLNTRTTYAHTENRLQASNNLTTWNFSYGGNTKITFPWGSNLSTEIHMFSRRGYSDATLNTNELIWNAQISHSFLRSKQLTVMLQLYDILHEQSTFSRTINANGWTDREVNAITSYAMLHISYRLNLFGGRGNGEGERREGRRGRFNGPPSGGFPGGSGGRFPGGGGGFPGGFPSGESM